MNDFVAAVASVLEVDALNLDTRFREAPGWCSLHAFGLLIMMENDWSTPLTVDVLKKLETVRDLYREAFISFAAKILKVSRDKLNGTTKYGEIPEWDSVNHLKLVMEAEKRFGVSYALEQIPSLATLDDFLV